jgi:hypothetical protein
VHDDVAVPQGRDQNLLDVEKEGFAVDRPLDEPWSGDAIVAQRCQSRGSAVPSCASRDCPDLNPIEQFFAKLKHWLRKAAQRTTDAVYDAIAPILDTVSPAECANYFANAGYDQT